jgi:hypothetical protein
MQNPAAMALRPLLATALPVRKLRTLPEPHRQRGGILHPPGRAVFAGDFNRKVEEGETISELSSYFFDFAVFFLQNYGVYYVFGSNTPPLAAGYFMR